MPGRKSAKGKAQSLNDNQDLYEKIGKRIKQLRVAAGYSNAEKFAFENNITRSQYANWEKGQEMKIGSIARIAKAHNLTLQEFFKGL